MGMFVTKNNDLCFCCLCEHTKGGMHKACAKNSRLEIRGAVLAEIRPGMRNELIRCTRMGTSQTISNGGFDSTRAAKLDDRQLLEEFSLTVCPNCFETIKKDALPLVENYKLKNMHEYASKILYELGMNDDANKMKEQTQPYRSDSSAVHTEKTIIERETVVKVKCRYCGGLNDYSRMKCESCGANL